MAACREPLSMALYSLLAYCMCGTSHTVLRRFPLLRSLCGHTHWPHSPCLRGHVCPRLDLEGFGGEQTLQVGGAAANEVLVLSS